MLSVLREAGTIAPAPLPPITPEDQIFEGFSDYLRQEHGLAPRSIISHLPVVRRFPREVCSPAPAISATSPKRASTATSERHARDCSAASGKRMCWSLRTFLQYLHHRGLTPLALADCGLRTLHQAKCRPICPPRRSRRSSMVAIGRPRWDGGIGPS